MMIGVKGDKLINDMLNPLRFKLGMLKKLPSVVFWGVKMRHLTPAKCVISLPYKWQSQNPFKSIYFAALAGAGELSTGALCLVHLADRGRWSMLVTEFRSEFFKKANTELFFTCIQGEELKILLDKIEHSGVSQTLEMVSIATNQNDEIFAKFYVKWSFKKKIEI